MSQIFPDTAFAVVEAVAWFSGWTAVGIHFVDAKMISQVFIHEQAETSADLIEFINI